MSNGNDEYGQFGKIFGNPPRSNPMGPFGSEEGYLPYDRETMDIQQALDAIKASMPAKAHDNIDNLIDMNEHKTF